MRPAVGWKTIPVLHGHSDNHRDEWEIWVHQREDEPQPRKNPRPKNRLGVSKQSRSNPVTPANQRSGRKVQR